MLQIERAGSSWFETSTLLPRNRRKRWEKKECSNGKHIEGSTLGDDVRGWPGDVCYDSWRSGGIPGNMESCIWETWAEDQQNKDGIHAEPHKWYRYNIKDCWCWTAHSDTLQIPRVTVHEWGRFTGWCQHYNTYRVDEVDEVEISIRGDVR